MPGLRSQHTAPARPVPSRSTPKDDARPCGINFGLHAVESNHPLAKLAYTGQPLTAARAESTGRLPSQITDRASVLLTHPTCNTGISTPGLTSLSWACDQCPCTRPPQTRDTQHPFHHFSTAKHSLPGTPSSHKPLKKPGHLALIALRC